MSEFYGNKKACFILHKYMEHGCTGNLILCGPRGVGKGTFAKKIAAHILGCTEEKLELHPDFIFLEAENRKISSEMVQQSVLDKCKYTASIADRKVVLVDDSECMNRTAQNKLLKEIEENKYATFIFVAHEKLLDTIMSRCFPVNLGKVNDDEMTNFFHEIGENDIGLYLSICNGSIGNYFRYKHIPGLLESAKNIIEHFSVAKKNERSRIFCICGQLIEKDKKSLYEQFGKEMDPFFQLFESIFYGLFISMTGVEQASPVNYSNMEYNYSMGLVINILAEIKEHALMYKKGIYSKNDFFRLLRLMA